MLPVLEGFNIGIGVTGIVICVLSILQIVLGPVVDKRTERLFLFFFSMMGLLALCNLLGLVLRGTPGIGIRIILYITNFGEFLFPVALVYLITDFLLSLLDPEKEHKAIRRIVIILVAIYLVMLMTSQFTGILYTIDEQNIYHRGAYYPLAYLWVMLIMIIDAYLLLNQRRNLTQNEKIAFWIYFIIPSIAAVSQLYIYGLSIVVFSSSVASFVMYIFILRDKTQQYTRQLEEISQLKTDILISQVQPHFIFNSLTAIRSLCDMDSEAYEAIGHFAGFLRGNLDLLNERGCIPFSREINTVENYLYMEKLRFDEKLQIEEDFRNTSFMIPACSLQILVENAVKHGIRQSHGGKGKLIMTSFEDDHDHVIVVKDNGAGFDTDEVSPGIGLSSMRRRLETMCDGKLLIESEPGKGTTATIIIPKNNREA